MARHEQTAGGEMRKKTAVRTEKIITSPHNSLQGWFEMLKSFCLISIRSIVGSTS
jgi:hypothetical protein